MGMGMSIGGLCVGYGWVLGTKGILLIKAYDHIRVAGLISNFIVAFLRRQNCQPDPFRR
jgi:hypothetical protein